MDFDDGIDELEVVAEEAENIESKEVEIETTEVSFQAI